MTTVPASGPELPKDLAGREQAKQRDWLVRAAAVLVGAACLTAAVSLQEPINRRREELQLVTHADIRNVPPKYAWITAMAGSFRGLAVNYLWYRAEELKQAGKYYESAQLADWITTMQPRFAAVWANRAWDLSYNISVGTHTPEERWQWVYNGIRLLRDRGIPNNPRVLPLYKELSWIFFHKIGEMSDDMHWFYKRELAALMENLLGPPPVGTSEEIVAAFRPVAEAPQSLAELLARHAELRPAIDALRAIGVDVTAGTSVDRLRHPLEETFFNRYGRLIRGSDVQLNRYRATAAELSETDRRFIEILGGLSAPARDGLLAFLRAKVLREQYRMDPAYMLRLMTSMVPGRPDLLIPLDWRLPESHAIYWSRYGVEEGVKLKNVSESDILNTDRYTVFGLMTLCKRGRLLFELNREKPNESAFITSPELRMVEPMHEMYLALGKRHAEKGEDVGQTAGEMLKSGHVNTLEEAVVFFYIRGRITEANRYYTYLRENYKEIDGSTKRRYQTDLETFVTNTFKELTEVYTNAVALIHQFLTHAMLSLAEGDADTYYRQVDRARLVHQIYMKEHTDERQGRLTMPPFEEIQAESLYQFLRFMDSILARATVWQLIDPRLKQRIYDIPDLMPALREECEARGLDVARAFPEPPGMEEYRKANPARPRPEDEYKRLFDPSTPVPTTPKR